MTMLSEFVFHGVPQGHDSWGASGDRYFESFYGIGDFCKGAKTVLIVEIRKDVTGFCSYYTYVRPQNVVAQGGRTGSYFGMSFKIEGQYCTDVYSLFQLFDKIYEEKILGSIIERTGNTEQYLIASFSDAGATLKTIAQLADNQVKNNFASDFDDIDASFTKQHATMSVYCNLDDVNSEAFFNTTRVYGKVFVSPEYASKDSIIASFSSSDKKYQALKADYEKQIADLQKENSQIPQLKSRVNALDADYNAAQKKLQELQATTASLKSSNTTLDQQLKKVQQECEQLKRSSNIGQVADRLEPSLNELLGIMRSVKSKPVNPFTQTPSYDDEEYHHHSSHHHRRREEQGFRRYIPIIIAAILAIALLVLLWKGIKSGPRIRAVQEEKASIEQKYNKLNQEYAALLVEVSTLRRNNDNMFTVLMQSDKYPNVSFEIMDDSNNPIYGALQLGKHYTVRCLGVEQNGEWKADGLNVKDRKKNPANLEVTKADKVTLSYYINKDKALSIEYKVTP